MIRNWQHYFTYHNGHTAHALHDGTFNAFVAFVTDEPKFPHADRGWHYRLEHSPDWHGPFATVDAAKAATERALRQ